MNTNVYDVIVVGLGAMGSAATYELSRRGTRVLGLDRYTPPHAHGSAAGETRIIREAYDGPSQYVLLVQHAYEAWRELEQRSGRPVLVETGGLVMGSPDGVLIAGALKSARQNNMPFDVLTPEAIRERFPLRPAEEMIGVLEPRAGMLYAERCIEAFLELSTKQGADLRFNEPADRWAAQDSSVTVGTANGEYHAQTLILAGGAWMPHLLGELEVPLEVERQVIHWVEPLRNPERFAPERMPVYIMEYGMGKRWYGFPSQPRGIKVALHHQGRSTKPDAVDPVSAGDRRQIVTILQRYMPDAAGRVLESATCMYTNTPDEDFILDSHPDHGQVVIASACSGHGFKFSVVIGEILTDLALERTTEWDLTPFRLNRF